MFETVVIATDGSESAQRGVRTAMDVAERFDATVHALYVVDTDEIETFPDDARDDLEQAIREAGDEALAFICEDVAPETDCEVQTAIERGNPAEVVIDYAESVEADVVAMGTRGRHGEHAFLLGSVAEAIVRNAPMPVLTVRQLEDSERS